MEERKTPYSDEYKARYEAFLRNKKEEREKNDTSLNQPASPDSIVQKAENEVKQIEQKVEEEIKENYKETKEFLEIPSYIRILKILALLIPLVILGYLVYANFLASQNFNYFYNIGSLQDAKTPYLSPLTRVSDIINGTPDYREMTASLVYFTSPLARGASQIEIQTRFKGNFPESGISLGAKDSADWRYLWKTLYNPVLQSLSNFSSIDRVYTIDTNLPDIPLAYASNMENSVISSNIPIENKVNQQEFTHNETIINASLRGAHTFYLYTSGNLLIEISKQDINWYNGTDEAGVSLYNSEDSLLANITIPDDGITDANHSISPIQKGNISINVPEGVYRLEISDFDGLIREIKVNTDKIVAYQTVYLADNPIFLNLSYVPSYLYTTNFRPAEISLKTWHNTALQNVSIDNISVSISQVNNETLYSLGAGEHIIKSEKNDIIVSFPGYFAFSEKNYFEPFKNRIFSANNNLDWIKNNIDYLVVDYTPPKEEDGWIVSDTNFNSSGLYVSNNKLSLVYNIPHLNIEESANDTISIDWINITVHKPGLFEKWSEK